MAIFNRILIILCAYKKSFLFERIIFPVNSGQTPNNTLPKLYYAILFTEDGAYYHGNNSGNNTLKGNTFTTKNGAGIYVGSEKYKDTIKVVKSVEGITMTETPDDNDEDAVVYTASKYQGGKIDLSNNTAGSNYAGIDVVDASGVKATAAAVSEYGTKFLKAHAGVDVTAAAGSVTDNVGTTFTGSAFNDRFTCGSGNDTIKYSTNQGSDIIKDFGVGDIIQLNGLSNADIAQLNALNSGTAQTGGTFTFTSGGSLAISSDANATMKLSYDATKKQIKGEAVSQG